MRKRYPSDLTDEEWLMVEPILPPETGIGRPRIHSRRAIVNAICYQERTSCSWRMLPHDLPPWQTVYEYQRRWKNDGTWQSVCAMINRDK